MWRLIGVGHGTDGSSRRSIRAEESASMEGGGELVGIRRPDIPSDPQRDAIRVSGPFICGSKPTPFFGYVFQALARC